jgi:signal transduction histidine kinase
MEPARRATPVVGSWPVAASILAVTGLLPIDVALGRYYLGVNLPAVAMGVAIVVALAAASRHLLVAAVGAAGTSIAASWLVHRLPVEPSRLGVDSWPGMAEPAGLALLTCWALRSSSARGAWAVSVTAVVAVVSIIERSDHHAFQPLLVLALVIGMGSAAGVGLYLRWMDHDRWRDVDRARQDERLAIARELHDVVAHHVTGIVVQAQAAQAVWGRRPDAALDALRQIESAGAEALGSMRRLVGTLRSDEAEPLAPAATLDELRDLVERNAATGLPVRLRLEGVGDRLPADLAAAVHRIALEALTNTRRHARDVTIIEVELTAGGGWLTLEVRDDGRAVAPPRTGTGGYGLIGMAERAEALGGRFAVGPRNDRGWAVRAELPLAVRR